MIAEGQLRLVSVWVDVTQPGRGFLTEGLRGGIVASWKEEAIQGTEQAGDDFSFAKCRNKHWSCPCPDKGVYIGRPDHMRSCGSLVVDAGSGEGGAAGDADERTHGVGFPEWVVGTEGVRAAQITKYKFSSTK